jgi:NAD-dependent dihydropyrimidine dehydrogenase PreA subunit
MVKCTENEKGRWVVLATDGKATWYRLGWIDYEKQKEACKNCSTGPWGWGAGSCADICQKAVVYIIEIKFGEPAILYTARLNHSLRAEPDQKIAEGRKAWEYLTQQGIPLVYL